MKKKKNLLHLFQNLPRKLVFMLRCCKEDDSQKDNTANSCKDDNPSTYEDGYLSTYEDVNDIPANNISNPMHDPEVLKLEMEKVNARDRVIAEKNLLITSLLSAPGALPPGWLFQFTPQGELYYINPSGQSCWEHPIIGATPSLTVASTGDDGIDMNQVAPPTPPSSGINAKEAASDELAPKRMTIKSVKTMRGANKKALNATKLKDKDNVTSDIEAATEGAI